MVKHRPVVARTFIAMREEVNNWKCNGETLIGIVPTMGALHAAHLALVRRAKAESERVIVTIFVNPTQFAPNEDLDAYPKDEEQDLLKLRDIKADLVYIPNVSEMYPNRFATQVNVAGITGVLCGENRPNHFLSLIHI